MTASEEVAAILSRRKWKAKRLSDEAGIPPSTVTRILNGTSRPLLETMQKLRDAAKRKRKAA